MTIDTPSTHTICINHIEYDTEKLAAFHPGGPLFVELFDGQNATDAFHSYHRRAFPHEKMVKYKSLVQKNTQRKTILQIKCDDDENEDEDEDNNNYNNHYHDTQYKTQMDPEYQELCRKIQHILPIHKSFAPWHYYIKVGCLSVVALYTEYRIHVYGAYNWYYMAFLGWIFALIGLNIQHDANHGAVSRYFWVNRILGMSQNWIGGSAIDWMHQHVVQHHIHCNEVHDDPDIMGNLLLRLNPLKPILSIHMFQYIYLFALLCLFGLSYSVDSIIHNFYKKNHTNYSRLLHPYMIYEKYFSIACLSRWIILPFFFTKESWIMSMLQIIPLFAVGGFYLAFFFILSHNYHGVYKYNRKVSSLGFFRKQVLTSSNVGGPWLAFVNGGLNYQIEHHLFPRIHHSHYPLIAPYVRQFCEKKYITYTHFPSIIENLRSCMKHLHIMGTLHGPPLFFVKEKND